MLVMGKISKKNVDYFEMFEKGIGISLLAAERLRDAFSNGNISIDELKLVKDAEHEGDLHVHQCLKKIDVAFITPIDRTDIVEIIKAIENITDSIEDVANHIYILRINEANEYLRKFVEYIVEACKMLKELMTALKSFKKNQKKINECIIEVNRIEEEGDRIYAEGMTKLFENETDPIKIIKQKDVYKLLEQTVDLCEDVADIVEKVMVAKT
jgi:predicted phosphate transport protein (TIGR00153 family)